MSTLRFATTSLAALALCAAAPNTGTERPVRAAPIAAAPKDRHDVIATPGGANATWRTILFRGRDMLAPPGVLALSDTLVFMGNLEVEFPKDVDLRFNEEGEAVFTLLRGAPQHSWVLRVGHKKLIVSPRARVTVPPPGCGEPRFQWSPLSYQVPAAREFLDQAYDLRDPFDASPYR